MGVFYRSRKCLVQSKLYRSLACFGENCRWIYTASSALLLEDHVFDYSPGRVEANANYRNLIDGLVFHKVGFLGKERANYFPQLGEF